MSSKELPGKMAFRIHVFHFKYQEDDGICQFVGPPEFPLVCWGFPHFAGVSVTLLPPGGRFTEAV